MKMRQLLVYSLLFCLSCTNSSKEISCYENAEIVKTLHGLDINLCVFYNNIDQAKKVSEETGKPILTIYGGWNCIGNSADIWRNIIDYETHRLINENYLVCYLYVDDKMILKSNEEPKLDYKNKPIITIGGFNLNRQVLLTSNNAQPFYSITDYKDQDLAKPINILSTLKKKVF